MSPEVYLGRPNKNQLKKGEKGEKENGKQFSRNYRTFE